MEHIAATEAYPTSNLDRAAFPPSRRFQLLYLKEPVPQASCEHRSPQPSPYPPVSGALHRAFSLI